MGAAVKKRQKRDSADAVFVLTTVPAYRRRVVTELVDQLGASVRIYAGREALDSTIQTDADGLPNVEIIRTSFLLRRRLIWQHVQLRAVLGAPVVVMQLNPRIVSTWLILFVRRLARRRSILWGHAFARRGPQTRTRWLRALMRSLPNELLVYTRAEAAQLRELDPRVRVSEAPNALYFKREMVPLLDLETRKGFIFVGRLVPSKKPELLVRAFVAARSELPDGCLLHIVGDGPLRQHCESLAREGRAGDSIRFYGEVTEYSALRSIYQHTLASVSPGYVGLSITQSLGFGVPMVIARDEPHAPEVEAARPGFNAMFVDSDDADALSAALLRFSRESGDWLSRTEAISDECAAHYSVEGMVDGFLRAIAGPERCP